MNYRTLNLKKALGVFSEFQELPQFNAVQKWMDVDAEIRLMRAVEDMMEKLKVLSLLISTYDSLHISIGLMQGGMFIQIYDMILIFNKWDVLFLKQILRSQYDMPTLSRHKYFPRKVSL